MNGTNWFIRKSLEKDELISSWLIRASFDMGCSPLIVVSLLWGKWRPLTIDIDKGVDEDKLSLLLEHCLETKENLKESMLVNSVGKVTDISYTSTSKWILALGTRNRKNFSGRQICPKCFEENEAYLKTSWRLGWNIICPIHQMLLIESCPKCKINFQPFRITVYQGSLATCFNCEFDYRTYSEHRKFDKDAFDFQNLANSVLEQNYGDYDGETLKAKEWFLIAHNWLSAIRSLLLKSNENIESFFKNLGVVRDSKIITPLAFEYLGVDEREFLLSILYKIIKKPTAELLELATDYQLTKNHFWDKRKTLPYQLKKFRENLDGAVRSYSKNRELSKSNRILSKEEVLKKYKKFLRNNNLYGVISYVDNE